MTTLACLTYGHKLEQVRFDRTEKERLYVLRKCKRCDHAEVTFWTMGPGKSYEIEAQSSGDLGEDNDINVLGKGS